MKLHHIVWTILVVLILIWVYRKWKSSQDGGNSNPGMSY